MRGAKLADFLKDKDRAPKLQAAQHVLSEEVQLICKDGTEVSMLMSGTSLPRDIGRKIYILNDLSVRKRMETLEVLRRMYNEIASQIKTPLSLAFTWLDLRAIESAPDVADLIDKTLRQLHKVDLTYERLLYYERQESAPYCVERSAFEIPVLVEKIKQRMPVLEAGRIEVTAGQDVPSVCGDISRMWFCLESLLAYFLRFMPENGKVTVDIKSLAAKVVVAIRGFAPQITGGPITDYAEARWAIQAITEMAAGEQTVSTFINRDYAGEFYKRRLDGGLVEYVITLPEA
jgi:signal transduction histidine kinase